MVRTETVMLSISVAIMSMWTLGGIIAFFLWIFSGRPSWFSLREFLILTVAWFSMSLILASSLFVGREPERSK